MPRAQTTRARRTASAGRRSAVPQPAAPLMRMTVYFQQDEWDALRKRSDKEDTTMANLIRRAVRSHLKLK